MMYVSFSIVHITHIVETKRRVLCAIIFLYNIMRVREFVCVYFFLQLFVCTLSEKHGYTFFIIHCVHAQIQQNTMKIKDNIRTKTYWYNTYILSIVFTLFIFDITTKNVGKNTLKNVFGDMRAIRT